MAKSINIYLVRHGEAAARWHEASVIAWRVVCLEPDFCSVTWLQGTDGGVQLRALGATRETLVL
ncbi:MAG: hypothetical protein HYX63_15240 [Gammaproteobacteria bacterium]|nr:hypothetical protein [Gammaproteobacteria bacterium]